MFYHTELILKEVIPTQVQRVMINSVLEIVNF